MSARPRWDRCISHRAAVAEAFAREFFGQSARRTLLVAGAGFDPRSTRFAEILSSVAGNRARGLFLREQRPEPRQELVARADANDRRLRDLIPRCTVDAFDVFDVDNAPVGGRRATAQIGARLDLGGVSDLVLDGSALSVGVLFPVAKYCYQRAVQAKVNFHLVVFDDPRIDAAIQAAPCGKAGALHSFQGRLGLEGSAGAARLWLPQLGPGRREVLRLVHQFVNPHAVCPILPFPAAHPREPDKLIEEYGDLFESVGDPFETVWHVDARDLVYAHQKDPLDLYRTILRIDEARRRVFELTGGSQLVLSPLGSKALGLGMFMAALERDFAVVSVESIGYRTSAASLDGIPAGKGESVHIWLTGEAYVVPEALDGAV